MIYFFSLEAFGSTLNCLNCHHESVCCLWNRDSVFIELWQGQILAFRNISQWLQGDPKCCHDLGFILIPSVLKFHNDRRVRFHYSAEHSGVPSSSKIIIISSGMFSCIIFVIIPSFFTSRSPIEIGYLFLETSHFPSFPYCSILWEDFFIFIFTTLQLLPFLFIFPLKKLKKRTHPKNFYFEIIYRDLQR